jgi:hypothetical protein
MVEQADEHAFLTCAGPRSPLHRFNRLVLLSFIAFVLSEVACGEFRSVDDVLSGNGSSSAGNGGSTTGGSSGTATGGSSGAATGGGQTGDEDCLDGADNDGDDAVDCADTDCTPDFECVPGVPAGFEGYFRVTQTDYPTAPPACDNGNSPAVFFARPAGAAECTECSCGEFLGAECSASVVSCWPGSMVCDDTPADWTIALEDGLCHKPIALLGLNMTLACSITAPGQVITDGSCEPSPVDFPNKDTWQNEVGACELPQGGGCVDAEVCVPKAAGSGAQALCVQQAGDAACPAGAFGQKVLSYAGGVDNRSCDDCTCDSTTTCGHGSLTVFDLDGCAGGGDPSVTIGAGCEDVSSLLDMGVWSMQASLRDPGGGCEEGGGTPQGQVTPQQPVTFCCQE